jgi:hypothetical protein
MVTVLDDLGLTQLFTSIAGLTPVGAVCRPSRRSSARSSSPTWILAST